jgi:restriction system protein
MRRLWKVTLGKHGEQEAHALDTGELVLGFRVPGLTTAKDRDAVLKAVEQAMPESKHKTQLNFAAQLNQFSNAIQNRDLVVVPLKTLRKIAVGEIVGPCTLTADDHPMRPVRWLKPDVPRDDFRQDLLFSFGSAMTVCEKAATTPFGVLKRSSRQDVIQDMRSVPPHLFGHQHHPTYLHQKRKKSNLRPSPVTRSNAA